MTEVTATDRRGTRAVAFDPMRRAIARTVTESAAIPTFTVTTAADVDALLSVRSDANHAIAATGEKLSLNAFVVRAVALALAEHPEVNATYSDEGRGQALLHQRINIGIAVDAPSGLVVPVLHDVDHDSVTEISRRTRDLVTRAHERKLQLTDVSDGTFTVSNLGMFGVEHFTALIIPPQGAVLAVGGVSEYLALVDGAAVTRHRLTCTLTADHRIIDGALAARFLATLTDILERPDRLRRG